MRNSQLTKTNGYKGYKVKVMLVREGENIYRRVKLKSSKDAYEFVKDSMQDLDREHFVVIYLDVKNYVIGVEEIAIGNTVEIAVQPKEVLKGALLTNAVGIIVAHNHPSGEPEPSEQDNLLTEKLKNACNLIGINLVDHIIVGNRRYTSFADRHEL